MRKAFVMLVAAALVPAGLFAQGSVGVALHAGSMGIGGDVAVSPGRRVVVRAGANVIPVSYDGTISGLDLTIDFPSPQFTALVDLMVAGPLRLSGGARISSKDITAVGVYTGSVDIGGMTYSGSEVGTLSGAIVTKTVSPYLGIGFGNVARSKVGFFMDLGVAFHGKPKVELSASGTATTLPGFAADLETQRQEMENDLDWAKVYPVVSLGLSFRLARF